MGDMPEVGILAADAREVRSRPLRSPQHRAVVLGLDGQRVRSVPLHLVAQRADHLAVAGVAAFADVDVAPGKLQRRVQPHVRRLLDRLVDGEERRDLDDAADARRGDDGDHESDRGTLKLAVEKLRHSLIPPARRRARRACPLRAPRSSGADRTVIQML